MKGKYIFSINIISKYRNYNHEKYNICHGHARYIGIQYKVIKWQLYVTPKKFLDKGVFPFENGVKKMAFSLIIYPLELRNAELQE